MNYAKFYKDAKQQLIEAMSSLWVPGHPQELEHIRELFEDREPIMSEPEFQTIFPWESAQYTFAEHATKLKLFSPDFIKALSIIGDEQYKEYSFPANRCPYKHQTNSWHSMLKDHKTIVVATGTGSGKTECFMLPVLQDLYNQKLHGVTEGVQAIFLYPLNALMKNQQQRIHAWCKNLNPCVTYAIYNGDTEKDRINAAKSKELKPQIYSRPEIRETPPQILFTNPTMLNYMLVRAEDRSIMDKSHGKLRWILLDEAHTYSGSSATELALQIRQVIDAFGVTIDQVNFAITSATIGDGNDEKAIHQLKENISKLTGKPFDDIVVVDGKRIIPELNTNVVETELANINKDFDTKMSLSNLISLRKEFNAVNCMSAKQITERFHKKWSIEQQLEFIDRLGTKVEGLGISGSTEALLPSRAHFFIRSINGIYTCLNPNCPSAKGGTTDIGTFTSYQGLECPHCHMPLLEVATCSDCGGLVVAGEYDTKKGLRMRINVQNVDTQLFELSDDDDTQSNTEIAGKDEMTHHQLFVIGKDENECPRSNINTTLIAIDCDTRRIVRGMTEEEAFVFKEVTDKEQGHSLCPHCGSGIGNKMQYFRASSAFMGRNIAPLLLENADPMEKKDNSVLYEGRKYITFTDSRQGTAKSAMVLNQDVERNWIRAAIFHELSNKRRDSIPSTELTDEERQLIEWVKGNEVPPFMKAQYEVALQKLSGEIAVPEAQPCRWTEIESSLMQDIDLRRLYKHLSDARKMNITSWNDATGQTEMRDYLQALYLDQLGWIPKRSNTLETLGFVHLVYPGISKAKLPTALGREGFTEQDWKDFLKISIDYFVRASRCLAIGDNHKPYLLQAAFTNEVYAQDSPLEGRRIRKWPRLDMEGHRVKEKQQRIVILLCAALGITDHTNVSQEKIDLVNNALQAAWLFLKDNVLQETDHENHGYRLDLINTEKVALQLMTDGWVCPVNNVVVDTLLCGYSPRLKGYINANNYERYRVQTEKLEFPYFPYAFRKDAETGEEVSDDKLREWAVSNWGKLYKRGIIRALHMRILSRLPIFMSGEHSAQQQHNVLKQYEEDFNEGKLNVLSCSTTMEMGVDLKGISEVVMNTVPPKPANYLQRAGRAGRRGESKAMAVTFCPSTPIGMNAWKNPSWPMSHSIQMPQIKLESRQIIQRHINSLLFAKHVASQGGMRITTPVGLYFAEESHYYEDFQNFLDRIGYGEDISDEIKFSYEALVHETALTEFPLSEAAIATGHAINDVRLIYFNRLSVLKETLSRAEEMGQRTRAYIAVSKKLKHYQEESLLSFLAENNFLPTAGIPTGLVTFMPRHDRFGDSLSKMPTQHLSQAISNYAPGKQIIINEWCYESSGIALKTKFDETKKHVVQSCAKCGYTSVIYGNPYHDCPMCHEHDSMYGVKDMAIGNNTRFTEVIEPVGFGVRFDYKPSRTLRSHNSMDMIQPVLLQMEPWTARIQGAKFAMRCSTPVSEILFYNRGTSGKGYALCPYCGRMESETTFATETADKNPLELHQHLETGGACEGSGDHGTHIHRNVLLVGRYQTDFVELKFYDRDNREIIDETTLYSLGVIVSRKLTEQIGVNDGEINFGYCSNYHSIFIYDTALGGAGYSPLLRDYKEEVLNEALKALEDCNCDSACIHCLIDRHSQWYINSLDRKKALDWLRMESEMRQAGDEIRADFPDATVVTSDFATEFYAITRDANLESVSLFINNDVQNWQPETFSMSKRLNEIKVNGVDVSYVVSSDIEPIELNAEYQSMLMSVLFRDKFVKGTMNLGEMNPLLLVSYTGGRKALYFGKDVMTAYNKNWGQGHLFLTHEAPIFTSTLIDTSALLKSFSKDERNFGFDYRILYKSFKSSDLLKIMQSYEKAKWTRVANIMTGAKVSIEYVDKFVNTPLGVYLVASFIQQLKRCYHFDVTSVTLVLDANLSNYDNGGNSHLRVTGQFLDNLARIDFIYYCFDNMVGVRPFVKTMNDEHSRPLSIKGETFDCCIRPDGGILHGLTLSKPLHSTQPEMTLGELSDNLENAIILYNYKHQKGGILYTIMMKECQRK